ncbi:hypothetical protein QBC32DRAFT_153736 [Pseudoneurospora amorphoporcata]|uniref:Extracellular serine-rich protein n=1 Tax=Pseudoneurospora amorphoporcata TaxID=241081 RepID=A0AAN6NU47_9PEZI|nr:hypothetical protein QBC32DRAFT_153736 [Pseudoneurospora amorphoporcata]
MHLTTNLLLASLATLLSSTTTHPIMVSAQKTHLVTVGYNGTLVFSPTKIAAQPGEAIQFQFVAGNHTVTQSTFDAPCQPISQNSNITGIHSGFMAAAADKDNVPVYTVVVKNKNPMWLYCAQAKHCQGGMVMVVNEDTSANATKSLENYKAGAAKATANIAPGGGGADAGNGTGGGSGSGSGSDSGSGSGSDSGSGSGSGTGSDSGSGSTNGSTDGTTTTTDPTTGTTTPSNSTIPSGSSTSQPQTAGAGMLSAATGATSMFALVAGGVAAFLSL